ncbi:MAG TPA: cob(I)yrinic acid a,c-diamide adenosyltransferase [Candidatus Dormibacteraeota bacterium]|nr:cob(I)yrinic acid a,c-diamide adenosyltransferase [Candidatus Dormibacteraeota bacterium]
MSGSIVTRHGDGGETGLLYGGRVPKDDLHLEAYGALDEAVSALGMARALETDAARSARILELQRELFTVGAELATAAGERDRLEQHFATVTGELVDRLERDTHAIEAEHPVTTFVIPGGTPSAAALDVARTVIRRTERAAVRLHRAGGLENTQVLRYLNRCSDLVFMLARQAEGGRTSEKPPER